MNNEQLIPALIFMTLGIVLVIGIYQYISINKKRRERENTPLTQHSEQTRREDGGVNRRV